MAVIGKVLKYGLGVYSTVTPALEFKRRRDEGQSMASAATKSLAEGVLWSYATGMMMAGTLGPSVIQGLGTVGKMQGAKMSKAYSQNFGGDYFDTEKNYTMRQASLDAMQRSQMNTRSVLGSEARRVLR